MTPFAAMFGFLCLVNVLSGSSGLNPLHGKLPSRKHRVERQANGNIDAALRNPSFVRFQLGCLLDRGSCDRIGHRIKSESIFVLYSVILNIR